MKKVIILLFFSLIYIFFTKPSFAAIITVCPTGASCTYGGEGQVVQEAIDKASDGDTILIQAGKYIRANGDGTALANPSGGIKSCFVDLHRKSLTLKGEGSPKGEWNGSVFFGEGHDKGTHTDGDPYYTRAGICSEGGTVTIDNLHIKEFEGGCMLFTNTDVTVKNSVVDGCDHGGIKIIGSSKLFSINSYFIAVIGIQPSNGASTKAINNIFYGKAIDYNCSEPEIPPIDFVNNVVSDIEETIGIGWIYSTCPEKSAGFKTQNIKYNVMWKDGHPCYPHEYCDNFTGKIDMDPLLDSPAIDQRGWRWGGEFSPKDGSPVINNGDPSIPGPKNIGSSGGPCLNGISTECTNYIKNNPARNPINAEPIIPQPPPGQPLPPGQQPPNPPGRIVFEDNVLPQFMPTIKTINLPNTDLISKKNDKKDVFMNIFMYVLFSSVFIMFYHLAISIQNFNIFLMIAYFALGGFVGLWFNSWEMGMAISMVLSLLFI